MCSHQEWESYRRRFDEGMFERQVREFVADAAARIETFVEELKSRACAPDDEDPGRGGGRRSQTQWV